MIVRLLPWLLIFAFGFFVGMMVFNRREGRDGDEDLQRRYRDLEARYRELTRRIGEVDATSDHRANRLRRTLWDVKGMLRDPAAVSGDRLRSALAEIDAALEETA